MDRSTRNLSIITLLVLAIFLALNHIARRSGLADWGLVLLFLLLALAIWFYDRVSRRGIDDAEMDDTLIEPLTYEHHAGAIGIPESIQVSGPDLTRSPEPIQEVPPAAPSQPETTPEPAATQPSGTPSSAPPTNDVEPKESEAPAAPPDTDQHPPATAPQTTTIEEKSAQPTSAPAPETHPDLADKSPDRTWSPSVPPDQGSTNEPVPTSVSGSAPEPVAPRTGSEPVPDIPPKESSSNAPSTPNASAESGVNTVPSAASNVPADASAPATPAVDVAQTSAPSTPATPTVSGDVAVSATPAANATPAAPDPNLPKNAAPDKPDDLKIIEGIGPKMEKALQAAGITTFAMLAGASEAQLRAAIVAAGMRFAPTVTTWAEQASYAANGDFVGLEAYQKTLIGGRKAK